MTDESESKNSCAHCFFYSVCPVRDLFVDAYNLVEQFLKAPGYVLDAVEEELADQCYFYTDQREGKK